MESSVNVNLMVDGNLLVSSRADINSCSAVGRIILVLVMNEDVT